MSYKIYKMKQVTLLLLVFVVFLVTKTTAQDLSLSFESSEGFTLGEINGQNGWTANPTYSPLVNVVDTKSTEGSNSLYFEDDPNGPIPDGGITGAISPTINFDDVVFTVDLFVESGQNPSEFDVILQSVASDALTSRVAFLNGDILVVDAVPGLQFVNVGTYTSDVWFELKIVHNFMTGTIEYSIDDTLIYTGNVVNGTNIDQMLLFSSFNQTGIYVDNVNFSTTLNVEEFENVNIDIYPNPTADIINIKTDNSLSLDDVRIYDMSGKEFEAHLNPDHSVNVDFLSHGVYHLILVTDKGKQRIQFMKK